MSATSSESLSASPSRVTRVRRRSMTLAKRKWITAYLFLAPGMVFFACLFFYPIGLELMTSFFKGPKTETFAGLGNYVDALQDPLALNSLRVTLSYAAGVVIVSILLGLLIAVILNQRLRGRMVMRGMLLVPYLTSVAIVGLLWRNILDGQVGILNRLLAAVDLPQQAWLNTHPLITLVAISVWQELGYTTLLFIAGLQGIPEVYYEAARIDGAGQWRRFVHITLPLLAPTTLFVCVVGVISSLQQFALPYIVTAGGPGNATDLFVYRMYETAFTFRDFGYSSALAFLMLIIILCFSIIQLRVGRTDHAE